MKPASAASTFCYCIGKPSGGEAGEGAFKAFRTSKGGSAKSTSPGQRPLQEMALMEEIKFDKIKASGIQFVKKRRGRQLLLRVLLSKNQALIQTCLLVRDWNLF